METRRRWRWCGVERVVEQGVKAAAVEAVEAVQKVEKVVVAAAEVGR